MKNASNETLVSSAMEYNSTDYVLFPYVIKKLITSLNILNETIIKRNILSIQWMIYLLVVYTQQVVNLPSW